MSNESSEPERYDTKLPARMDRLPWSRFHWLIGYVFAAVLVVVAGIMEWFWGIEAAQKSLEEVSTPLSAFEDGRSDSNADAGSGATGAGGSD